jgi:hypothetical protein
MFLMHKARLEWKCPFRPKHHVGTRKCPQCMSPCPLYISDITLNNLRRLIQNPQVDVCRLPAKCSFNGGCHQLGPRTLACRNTRGSFYRPTKTFSNVETSVACFEWLAILESEVLEPRDPYGLNPATALSSLEGEGTVTSSFSQHSPQTLHDEGLMLPCHVQAMQLAVRLQLLQQAAADGWGLRQPLLMSWPRKSCCGKRSQLPPVCKRREICP